MDKPGVPDSIVKLAKVFESYYLKDKNKITPENSIMVDVVCSDLASNSKGYFLKSEKRVILEKDVHRCLHCRGLFLHDLADAGLIEEPHDHDPVDCICECAVGRTCPECVEMLVGLLAIPMIEEALSGKAHFEKSVKHEEEEDEIPSTKRKKV